MSLYLYIGDKVAQVIRPVWWGEIKHSGDMLKTPHFEYLG